MSLHDVPANGDLPLAVKETIDRICLAFEDQLQSGGLPRIEEFLYGFSGRDRDILLHELLLVELAYLQQQGKPPSREPYERRFPEQRPVLAAVFASRALQRQSLYQEGERNGDYVIEKLLGRGAFGEVYLATDTRHARRVAVKVPTAEGHCPPDAAERFLEEARVVQRLNHTAIVPVLEVLRHRDGWPWLVMPFIDGLSLRARLEQGPLGRPDAIRILIEIAEAVGYAHQEGIVHRDLEPRNVLLDHAARPYVSDFGLALDERIQEDREGESAGSLAYMAPEQIRGESHWLDGRADIWSLGVILYELLTQRRPFQASESKKLAKQILEREPKPLRQIDGAIPAELERICLKCLSKRVADRYPTAEDLAEDLRRVPDTETPDRSAASFQPTQTSSDAPPGASPLVDGFPSFYSAASGALLAAVAILVLALASGVTRDEQPAGPPSLASPGPQELAVRDIAVDVYAPIGPARDRFQGRISRHEAAGAPLQTGHKIRLSVNLSRPAYVYILWLDPDGELMPVYPWQQGDWSKRPGSEQPTDRLSLPSPQSTWTIEPGQGGTATILVFGSPAPLAANAELSALQDELQPQSAGAGRHGWFVDGQELLVGSRRWRGPDLAATAPLDDPVLANQRVILACIVKQLGANAALCLPVALD